MTKDISITVEKQGHEEVLATVRDDNKEVTSVPPHNLHPPSLPQIESLLRRVMKEENQILLEEVEQRLASAEQRIVSRVTAHLW